MFDGLKAQVAETKAAGHAVNSVGGGRQVSFWGFAYPSPILVPFPSGKYRSANFFGRLNRGVVVVASRQSRNAQSTARKANQEDVG